MINTRSGTLAVRHLRMHAEIRPSRAESDRRRLSLIESGPISGRKASTSVAFGSATFGAAPTELGRKWPCIWIGFGPNFGRIRRRVTWTDVDQFWTDVGQLLPSRPNLGPCRRWGGGVGSGSRGAFGVTLILPICRNCTVLPGKFGGCAFSCLRFGRRRMHGHASRYLPGAASPPSRLSGRGRADRSGRRSARPPASFRGKSNVYVYVSV